MGHEALTLKLLDVEVLARCVGFGFVFGAGAVLVVVVALEQSGARRVGSDRGRLCSVLLALLLGGARAAGATLGGVDQGLGILSVLNRKERDGVEVVDVGHFEGQLEAIGDGRYCRDIYQMSMGFFVMVVMAVIV
jgi:hypothetical protein